LTNHPEESWELFIRAYPDLDDELNRQAWLDTLPRFAKRPAALDHRRYARFGAFMAQSGLIEQAPEVEEIAVELRKGGEAEAAAVRQVQVSTSRNLSCMTPRIAASAGGDPG